MSNRMLLYMTGLVLLAVAVLVTMNLFTIFQPSSADNYISRNNVRGMAVLEDRKPFTLNFDQQNRMIDFLNASTPIGIRKGDSTKPLDFEEIVVYQFSKTNPSVTVTPMGYDEDDGLIFSANEWNSFGYLKDQSKGLLKKLISETYD